MLVGLTCLTFGSKQHPNIRNTWTQRLSIHFSLVWPPHLLPSDILQPSSIHPFQVFSHYSGQAFHSISSSSYNQERVLGTSTVTAISKDCYSSLLHSRLLDILYFTASSSLLPSPTTSQDYKPHLSTHPPQQRTTVPPALISQSSLLRES